LTLQKRQW